MLCEFCEEHGGFVSANVLEVFKTFARADRAVKPSVLTPPPRPPKSVVGAGSALQRAGRGAYNGAWRLDGPQGYLAHSSCYPFVYKFTYRNVF